MWLSGGESGRGQDDLFIALEGESQTVQGGWLTTVVRIQCFSERDEAEATRSSWRGTMRWCGDVGQRRGDTEEGKGRR
jgi:hypothetical protein